MRTLSSVINRFVEYYAGLDNQPLSALTSLYHSEAQLIDPFGEHRGVFEIQRYFTQLLVNVEHCRFSIDVPVCDGHRYAVSWTMHWSYPRLSAENALAGCSMLELQDNLIIRQRDYYDAGEMIYEHIPLLGWAIRGVKRRMLS